MTSIISETDKGAYKAEKDAPRAVVRDRRVNSSTPSDKDTQLSDSDNGEMLPPNEQLANEKMATPTADRKWWHAIKEPGSALQIIVAAAIALGIAIGVSEATEVPAAAITILIIPGNLWLRALTCVVLPMIVVAIILAMVRLREISKAGPTLAKWTIGYYVTTTLIAIGHSTLMTAFVWANVFVEMDPDSLVTSASEQAVIDDRSEVGIPQVVTELFNSFVARNVVQALAENSLLAVLVISAVVGYLAKPKGLIVRLAEEVEKIIQVIITFLIALAPIGVFFLILSNMMRLDIAEIGQNIGYLIAGTLCNMAIHTFVVMPIIFIAITRTNPFTYMFRCGSALMVAWGTASSAATMPLTLREARKRGNPIVVVKFLVPLGTLVNMDGTAIYFPIVVNFLASTQGLRLNAADWIILVLLSTLASIGTTPIPSSSLVLVIMIAQSVNVPITGAYGLVTAIDWFLDRFRTTLNVNGDLWGCRIVHVLSKMEDPPGMEEMAGVDIIDEGQRQLWKQRHAEEGVARD